MHIDWGCELVIQMFFTFYMKADIGKERKKLLQERNFFLQQWYQIVNLLWRNSTVLFLSLFCFCFLTGLFILYLFLIAALTNDHQFSGLKEHKFILQILCSEVWDESYGAKINVGKAAFFLEVAGRNLSLSFSAFILYLFLFYFY